MIICGIVFLYLNVQQSLNYLEVCIQTVGNESDSPRKIFFCILHKNKTELTVYLAYQNISRIFFMDI